MVEQLNALQIDLAAQIRQTTDQLKGINADLAVVKVKISGMQATINVIKKDYAALLAQLADLDAQLVGSPPRSGQAHRAGRAEGDPGGPPPQRVRHGPDVAPRVVPVERLVHRPPRGDELLHRRRRAGQGPRRAGRRRPGDARRDPPDDERHAHPDRRPAPRRRPPRSAPSTGASPQLNAAKVVLRKLEKRVATSLRSRSATTRAAAEQGRREEGDRKGQHGPEALKGRSTRSSASSCQGGNIPSQYNGTLSGRCTATSPRTSAAPGSIWEPPQGRLQALSQRDRPGRAVRHAGEGVRRRDRRLHRLELADGADPAWIVIIAHSEGLQTWYAHMQPATRAGSTPAARCRVASSSATRATPATRPAPTSTGASCSTATSSIRGSSCSVAGDMDRRRRFTSR